MTHLMFEINLLLGCEVVCRFASYFEWKNSKSWGIANA